ncbi:MAG: type transport system permease protein [Solirubrobacteraceae bacterium]|nr:type transport system permease protein [Solirubrobacteraceae bacterium]
MTALLPTVDGVLGVAQRDAAIFFSYRLRAVAQALLALCSVTLFYYVSRLVGNARFPSADAYFAYVVVGLVILHALTATLAVVPNTIRTELVAGTFERLVISPIGPALGICAMTLFPALAAAVTGVLTLLFAVVLFGCPLAGAEALLAIGVAPLAMASFLPFALIVAALVLVSKQAGNLGNLVVIALSLAGGVYYPPELMPGWISWVSDVQPFTPALDLLRHLIIGSPATITPAHAVERLVAFAVLGTPVAYLVLRSAVSLCRRRGTLVEY